jgi:hypothetical protein
MARKSFVELSNDLLTAFPDNISGLITPAILRAYFQEFLDAIRPAYGLLDLPGPTVQTLQTTYAPLVCTTGQVSAIPDFTVTPATGTVNRVAAGMTRLTASLDIECTQGRVVWVSVYKNGLPTPWIISTVGEGAGKPASVALAALSYDASPVAYQFMVKCDTAGTAVTFSNGIFIAETVPVNAY